MLPLATSEVNVDETNPIVVGRIGGAYGLKGWVKIISFTEPREGILDYKPWLLQLNKIWQPVKILAGRLQGKGLVVQFENCHKPEDIKGLVNTEIGIHHHQLPKLPVGEYYWAELIGLRVVNSMNLELG